MPLGGSVYAVGGEFKEQSDLYCNEQGARLDTDDLVR